MVNCSNELKIVAAMLDPLNDSVSYAVNNINALEESRLVELLCTNRVALKFKTMLDRTRYFDLEVRNSSHLLKDFYQFVNNRTESHSCEFKKISQKLSERGIRFILMKSDGDFPYESENLDVLAKEKDLSTIAQLLKANGYAEIVQVREPHKFLFRKTSDLDQLAFHIHTRIEWEGTQFVDSRRLWDHALPSFDSNEFFIPSSEDCVLITLAHLFFENHGMKLADLLKIDAAIRNNCLDWDYLIAQAKRFFWEDVFVLMMLLTNDIYSDLYGRDLIQKEMLLKMGDGKYDFTNVLRKILRGFYSGFLLLKIPYTISALFFFRRVIRQSNQPFRKKLGHLAWVASDIFRRTVR